MTRKPGSQRLPSAHASCRSAALARSTRQPPGCGASSGTCTTVAQVRLAALALALGEIKENVDAAEDHDGAGQARTRMLIGAAHRNAKETLAELRDLARGIHPAVLDRGSLTPRCPRLAKTQAARRR